MRCVRRTHKPFTAIRLSFQIPAGGSMSGQRSALAATILLLALVQPSAAQETAPQPDSVPAQIRAVLRAYYLNLANQNWDALSTYVLSPKLLERRGACGDVQSGTRDRTRGRGSSHATV